MQKEELAKDMDFLLSASLQKCDSLEDARDLTQETMLAALVYLNKGNKISDLRGWLLTVMNRRYYDKLRKKYRLPTVTIGEAFDIPDETVIPDGIIKTEEAEAVRREIAYLSELYRTIIARHYYYGDSIEKISRDLNIPQGTVKSRLSFARNEIKKGMNSMEKYIENSYIPQRLYVRNSGKMGLDDEPMSLVPDDDILSQNLLILAYEKPVTIVELAKAIGIPTAYIEPVINKLVSGELMKKQGDGKVYTDFVIYDPEDWFKYVKDQKQFAKDNAEAFCTPMKDAIEKLKKTDFYSERLERYMIINIAQMIISESLMPHLNPQIFPDRPNGGKWIAFGTRYPDNYIITEELREYDNYSMSGERWTNVDEYLGSRNLTLHNFETSLYSYEKYTGFGYNNFSEMETDLLKLFYIIKKNISPESVGFTPKMLKNLPLMQERGMIKTENGKPILLVPCLTHEQYNIYRHQICREAVDRALPAITEKMGQYIRTRKKKLPPHLKSVPDQKRTMPYEPSPMVLVYEAINRGIHKLDLGYPCPEMIVVID